MEKFPENFNVETVRQQTANSSAMGEEEDCGVAWDALLDDFEKREENEKALEEERQRKLEEEREKEAERQRKIKEEMELRRAKEIEREAKEREKEDCLMS